VKNKAVAPCECGGRIERRVDRLPCTLDSTGICNGDDRPQQCLAGDARPVLAFAADQLFLHYHNAESGTAGPAGKGHADRTPAEDHDVIGVF
jgi:hypothetical protein